MLKPPKFEVRFLGAFVSGEGIAGIVGAIVTICALLAIYRWVVVGDLAMAILR